MIDGRIASEAVELVHGDRQDSYGSPRDNLGRIAGMWSAYLGADVSAHDVANMMTLLKVARARHAYKRDNYVDGIAYLLLGESLDRTCE